MKKKKKIYNEIRFQSVKYSIDLTFCSNNIINVICVACNLTRAKATFPVDSICPCLVSYLGSTICSPGVLQNVVGSFYPKRIFR